MIDNFSAANASPAPKASLIAVKFLLNHMLSASMTDHLNYLPSNKMPGPARLPPTNNSFPGKSDQIQLSPQVDALLDFHQVNSETSMFAPVGIGYLCPANRAYHRASMIPLTSHHLLLKQIISLMGFPFHGSVLSSPVCCFVHSPSPIPLCG